MKMEQVFYSLLSGNVAVMALVQGRIFPTNLPVNERMPALVYEVVSRVERTTVSSAEPTVHVRYRVQVDIIARDYDQLTALAAAVRGALANVRGDIAGAQAVTIRPESHNVDVYNEDGDFYTRSADFLATLLEPVS